MGRTYFGVKNFWGKKFGWKKYLGGTNLEVNNFLYNNFVFVLVRDFNPITPYLITLHLAHISHFDPLSRNEKPFSCSICGGRFSRYSSLWSHKKLHSGEKNYKCGVCGIAFAKAVYLKNHTRIHTGEKPYK